MLADCRKSSWHLPATSMCWACRKWGYLLQRSPRPKYASSLSPGGNSKKRRWYMVRFFLFWYHIIKHISSNKGRPTCLDFHTSRTGMPAIIELGSSCAAEFTVSLAPMTSVKSVSVGHNIYTFTHKADELRNSSAALISLHHKQNHVCQPACLVAKKTMSVVLITWHIQVSRHNMWPLKAQMKRKGCVYYKSPIK